MHIPYLHWELFSHELTEKILPKRYLEFSELKWFDLNAVPKDAVYLLKWQLREFKKILRKEALEL
jgi:hypothetical protein